MPVRGDITIEWPRSPRIVSVAAPSTEVTLQDLVDTLRGIEDQLDQLDDFHILNADGRQDLGGGDEVGITLELQNAVLQFEDRTVPDSTGSITTGDVNGETLIDIGADFVADAILAGAIVYNENDGSLASVIEVVNLTTLITRPLTNGADDQYDISDTYRVHNVIACVVKGGNLVAVDAVGDPADPLRSSLHTRISAEKATSAALVGGSATVTEVEDSRDAVIQYVGQKIT